MEFILEGDKKMSRPSGETTASTTFVVRFWREWTGAESRWRGRIEHVQSGRRHDFLGVEGLLGFLERFGIGAETDPVSTGEYPASEEDGLLMG
jgi:hypothetical protein